MEAGIDRTSAHCLLSMVAIPPYLSIRKYFPLLSRQENEDEEEEDKDDRVLQEHGMTKTTDRDMKFLGPDEATKHGFVGRLSENMEAKMVYPSTWEALPLGQKGELWLKGPIIIEVYDYYDQGRIHAPELINLTEHVTQEAIIGAFGVKKYFTKVESSSTYVITVTLP